MPLTLNGIRLTSFALIAVGMILYGLRVVAVIITLALSSCVRLVKGRVIWLLAANLRIVRAIVPGKYLIRFVNMNLISQTNKR